MDCDQHLRRLFVPPRLKPAIMAYRIDIDVALVRALIAEQFPQWTDLEIRPVARQGWDNRTFRLGDALAIRLPSAERYAAQVGKEQQWLPRLAPFLTLPIPKPVAQGRPTADYPYPWSILQWIPGEPLSQKNIGDQGVLAADAARFLKSLHAVDASHGPQAGNHNFHRGGSLQTYDRETRAAIEAAVEDIDTAAATAVWQAALRSGWHRPGVWVHGDVAPGNLLTENGRLCAVIDFGCLGVGDPACDLVLSWTFLTDRHRKTFRHHLSLDDATWARARGWALWKALLIHTGQSEQKSSERPALNVIESLLDEHRQDPAA